jgi:hypothetical protein
MPEDSTPATTTPTTTTTPDGKPRQVMIGMSVDLPEAIDVDLDPLVITIPIPAEWFDASVRQAP